MLHKIIEIPYQVLRKASYMLTDYSNRALRNFYDQNFENNLNVLCMAVDMFFKHGEALRL